MIDQNQLRQKLETLANIKYLNRWVVFLSDLVFSLLSTLLALVFLSFTMDIPFNDLHSLLVIVASFTGSIASFFLLSSYKGVIRHSTFMETGRIGLVALIKVVFETSLLFNLTVSWSTRELVNLAMSDMFLTFFLLITFRVLLIGIYRFLNENAGIPRDNILIYGSCCKTAAFLNGSIRNLQGPYRIIGCIHFEKHTYRISGYKVYSIENQKDFNELVKQLGIRAVLFPDYNTVKQESERMVRFCEKMQLRMLMMPSVDEVRNGSVNFSLLPEVRIEDLLGRDEIQINLKEIAHELIDKTVLVTGAAGSIGSELCRQLCSFRLKQLILFDSAETPMHNLRLELEEKFPDVKFLPVLGDVRILARLESVFIRFTPQIVFHAAAYKHVPLMEENPCEAVHTNVFGTRNAADLSVKYRVDKFIMISTDKAVNPTNVMGASKRLAEIYVQSLGVAIRKGMHPGNTRFITTRFGNVLGSNGSVIPRFREQLLKGGPLTVTHPDIIRYFMTIPEACRLVLEAAFMGKGNEIFVFDMGEPVRIADLAKRMIQLAGLKPDIDVEIRYTGLRPGEKLFEELLATKENTLPTLNEKIFRATVRVYDYKIIAKAIHRLIKVAGSVDKMETVRIMKELVPEFKSQQSVYEVLDKLDKRVV